MRRQLVVEEPGSRVRAKPPKSHNGVRTLVLDSETLDLLRAAAAGQPSRYMFTGRSRRPMRPDNLTDRFNQRAVAAKVRPIGPHQIRHLIASTLLDAGYGVHEVAERLGHDPATLMPYYTRVSAARRLQATDRIAELMTLPERPARPLRNRPHGTTTCLVAGGWPDGRGRVPARGSESEYPESSDHWCGGALPDPETRPPTAAIDDPASAGSRGKWTVAKEFMGMAESAARLRRKSAGKSFAEK